MYVYYRLLGLRQGAGDDEIRTAYLKLVKQFSPEKSPDQFQRITRAYEALKDSRSRVRLKVVGPTGEYKVWTEALEDVLETIVEKRRSPGMGELVEAWKKENGEN